MKATIIMIISILVGSVFAYAQNDSPKLYNTVLCIIKTDTKDIKTNHFYVDAKDIQALELPSKASVSKSFGPVSEDVVMIFTLKKRRYVIYIANAFG